MSAIIIASEAKKKAVRVLTRPEHLSMLYSPWPSLARELDVDEVNIKTLRDKIIWGTCYLPDAISAVIEDWVSRKGCEATLSIFVSALEKLGLKYIAEALEDEFGIGKTIFVEDVASLNNTLPDNIPYYIPRTLVSRYNLDSETLFENAENVQDVFCFTGIQRYELASFVKNSITDNSSGQIQRELLTTRFIILDRDAHFPKICGKSFAPTHWIHFSQHDNDISKKSVKWIQSTGKIATIQRSIISNSEEQEKLKEERILQITKDNKNPVCFSDSPGMGKSILLINIGHKIKEMLPERIIVHFELRIFVHKMKSLKSSSNRLRFESVLFETLCKPGLGKVYKGKEELLKELTYSDTLKIELLLDGFDEIFPGDVPFCLDLIKDINALKYTRIWIASRPHFLERIENALNVLGYNIHPFTEENQISFLSSYWLSQNQCLSTIQLTKLAVKSLKIIEYQTQDQDFAGIPLRCFLIAQVFEEAAMDFCAVESEGQELPDLLAITSTFDLFTKMIEMKFRKYYSTYGITKYRQEALTRMLMKLAVDLIFPEHLTIINSELGSMDVSVNDLTNTGLLVRQGADDFNRAKFVHQTVAEYFCARFVSNLVKQGNEEWTEERQKFFFREVLQFDTSYADIFDDYEESMVFIDDIYEVDLLEKCVYLYLSHMEYHYGDTIEDVIRTFKNCWAPFTHPVICYFLNSFLSKNYNTSIPAINSDFAMTSLKDLIWICVQNDFLNIFKLLTLESLGYNGSEIFDHDFLFVLLHFGRLDLIQVGFPYFEKFQKLDLNLKIYTLRHVGKLGDFSVFEYFCKGRNFEEILLDDNEKNIFIPILKMSDDDSENVVNQKIQILRYIHSVNPSLINTIPLNFECTVIIKKGCTDLNEFFKGYYSLSKIHFDLLCCLLELDLNLERQDEFTGDTFLHHIKYFSGENTEIYKIIRLIPLDKFKKLVQIRNKKGETILHIILEYFDVSISILDQFKAANADFNSCDNEENNLLMKAIQSKKSGEIVKYLLNEGANPNHVNESDRSVLFLWTITDTRDISVLEELIKAGCDVFRQRNVCTFLHTLLYSEVPLNPDIFHAVVQILIANGKEKLLETKSEWEPKLTPLQLALKRVTMNEETFTLLKSVESLNFENLLGEQALEDTSSDDSASDNSEEERLDYSRLMDSFLIYIQIHFFKLHLVKQHSLRFY